MPRSSANEPYDYKRRFRLRLLAIVGLFVLIAVASLFGGHGKRSKEYFGFTSGTAYNGFYPSVSFTVAGDGSHLTGFRYETFGCLGDVPERLPQRGHDYYNGPSRTIRLGDVPVAGDSTFAARSVLTTHANGAASTATTTSVSGRFAFSGAASGLITFEQRRTAPGATPAMCGPVTVRLNANPR